ncbi:MAG: TonB-dependent receptor [Nitrospirae bacterium]|nr:TonB-dependent receptor [Nitrospirota bacterium]
MSALAQTEDEQEKAFINMFTDQSVVTATRSSKPMSQVAENVTIITAKDIELMGAHTLTDVLFNVTGVQVETTGGPGSIAPVYIQGSETRQVTIAVDGMIINNLSDTTADTGAIPVQNIERIEIIKGPASSAWGSALGGIINVITKSANTTKGIKGTLSASYGQGPTTDDRAELFGRISRFGYYFYAGTFHTDGFRPFNMADSNNVYTKLEYHLTDVSDLALTVSYTKGDRGVLEQLSSKLDVGDFTHYLRSSLSYNTKLADNMDLGVSLHALEQKYTQNYTYIPTGQNIQKLIDNDTGIGGSIKAGWRSDTHNIVLGGDWDSRVMRSNSLSLGKRRIDKTAAFLNDTITIGRLTVTPGVRYDNTNTNGDFMSPSFGATYKLSDDFLLRAGAARGFNVPPLGYTYGNGTSIKSNPDLKVEDVTSYQAGVETTVIPYANLKVMFFHHSIANAIAIQALTARTAQAVNKDKERRQGMETEISTLPIYNISLTAGAAFMGARNTGTDTVVLNTPTLTYDFGIKYNDNSLKALLKGHYIWWNDSSSVAGRYNAFIVDANVTKVLLKQSGVTWETYLTLNNIFDGKQYLIGAYPNPGRWVEGGMRVAF